VDHISLSYNSRKKFAKVLHLVRSCLRRLRDRHVEQADVFHLTNEILLSRLLYNDGCTLSRDNDISSSATKKK